MENTAQSKKIKKGYRIIFLSSLLLGTLFECLIFVYHQVNKINAVLSDDFRIILVVSNPKGMDKMNSELDAMQGVRSHVFVPSSETLKKIKSSDGELYASIAAVGKNPVPDIVELEVEQSVLGNMDELVDRLLKLDGVADIKYKVAEAYALLHFSFYSNFISVVISLSALIAMLIIFMGIAHVGIQNFFGSVRASSKWFAAGALGAGLSVLFTYIIIYPVKYLSPLWEWPSAFWHIGLTVFCGLIGWVLYQWKNSNQ